MKEAFTINRRNKQTEVIVYRFRLVLTIAHLTTLCSQTDIFAECIWWISMQIPEATEREKVCFVGSISGRSEFDRMVVKIGVVEYQPPPYKLLPAKPYCFLLLVS